MNPGQEWLVDAHGCAPERLRDKDCLSALFDKLVTVLKLGVVSPGVWHQFPGEGGITGLLLLTESHLAIHTFPETGFAAISLYSCNARARPDFLKLLGELLGAREVHVTEVERGTGGLAPRVSGGSGALRGHAR